jgi:hypothetical protein
MRTLSSRVHVCLIASFDASGLGLGSGRYGTSQRAREITMEPTPIANRLGMATLLCLLAAFVLSTMPVLLTPAAADADITGVRDDDGRDVATVADDDDDDDDDNTDSDSDSGSRSIGSRSGNTATGTTRGTGKSRSVSNSSDKSRDTHTGTTRGTGKSRSVSNSS